ncbi:MAG: hypothetical protein Q7Q73_14350, partial [Verrucomicrobiota bacterium JB024]|nr:hypothetical protein [Verrucomicrobiota bacterium JB024]
PYLNNTPLNFFLSSLEWVRPPRRGRGGRSQTDFEHHENEIISHFEKTLDQWANISDGEHLKISLDVLCARNRSSEMWQVFMRAGAKYPSTLGKELEPLLLESVFLTHADYCEAGRLLFAALHKVGDAQKRKWMEKLLLNLPQTAHLFHGEPRSPTPSYIVYAQKKLLLALDEGDLVLEEAKSLWFSHIEQRRKRHNEIVDTSSTSVDRQQNHKNAQIKDPVDDELILLIEAIKPVRDLRGGNLDSDILAQAWVTVEQSERAVAQYLSSHGERADELWGYLVGACRAIAGNAEWSPDDGRWSTLRRIFLKALTDPRPIAREDDDQNEEKWPSYTWPAPRLDAACGLLYYAYRIGGVDSEISEALHTIREDKSEALRFYFAERLHCLSKAAPKLMWELVDHFIYNEIRFSVLTMIVRSLDHLWHTFPAEVSPRLSHIAKQSIENASDENIIHPRLTNAFLFHYFRTGDPACEWYIRNLVQECDCKRVSKSLDRQFFVCREGGWLTAGDAVNVVAAKEATRERTWTFLKELLASAQSKLEYHRKHAQKFSQKGDNESEGAMYTQEAIRHTLKIIDDIARELYFTSGAFSEKQNDDKNHLTEPQKQRFWIESASVLRALAEEPHPSVVHNVVQTLHHLLPCSPQEVFILATNAIISGSKAGYQYDSLALGKVVELLQQALADHRDIFKVEGTKESKCLTALLQILDLFVEAGWSEARQLTHRLEEIYR